MLDDIVFQHRMRSMQKQKTKIVAERDNSVSLAKRSEKSMEAINDIDRDFYLSECFVDDKIRELQHAYIMSMADRLLVPVPPMSLKDGEYEHWERSDISGRYRLKDASLVALRSAVRAERKERREAWLWMVSGFTGLGGVAIGILSLILKK